MIPASGGDDLARAVADRLGPAWAGARVATVLGSGLGGAADGIAVRAEVSYEDVPGLGACSVPGHRGRLLRGTVGDAEVVAFVGRRHAYEGISLAEAALPARIAQALGAGLLVSLSAVGGIAPGLGPGAWVLVEDHLNLMGRNPLEGVRGPEGPAFVDLTRTYRADLFEPLAERLERRGVRLARGVLASFPGPSYETPAEVRMAASLGADIVGMSTVPEAVWARWLGLDVLAYGRVANRAAGLGPAPLDHAEVLREGAKGGPEAVAVLEESVAVWKLGA
ncbi:MAG: purine-nucleoside phosphorylase [Deltaproteobacteria bacterium]|nr:purine-nucleoside phosphorylase [Deltaproteobacteria bacterium]